MRYCVIGQLQIPHMHDGTVVLIHTQQLARNLVEGIARLPNLEMKNCTENFVRKDNTYWIILSED